MFWKNTISINPPSSLRYKTKSNSIIFWCSGLDFDNKFDKHSDATAALLSEFFIGLSGKEFATRLLSAEGRTSFNKKEFSQLKKYGDRGFSELVKL